MKKKTGKCYKQQHIPAFQDGHFEICKMIVKNVANKNPADNEGITPLHNAAINGHFEIFRMAGWGGYY